MGGGGGVTTIPSMGGTEIGPILRKYASRVPSGQAIVELGCWLGAGTRQLLDGVQQSGNDVVVHSFDKFQVNKYQKKKAAEQGVALVDSHKQFQLNFVEEVRVGRLRVQKTVIDQVKWGGPQIGLYVDDACKRQPAFDAAVKIFSPYWVPGQTILALMDFWYFLQVPGDDGLRYQHDWISNRWSCFEVVEELDRSTCTAVFRYLGGL